MYKKLGNYMKSIEYNQKSLQIIQKALFKDADTIITIDENPQYFDFALDERGASAGHDNPSRLAGTGWVHPLYLMQRQQDGGTYDGNQQNRDKTTLLSDCCKLWPAVSAITMLKEH